MPRHDHWDGLRRGYSGCSGGNHLSPQVWQLLVPVVAVDWRRWWRWRWWRRWLRWRWRRWWRWDWCRHCACLLDYSPDCRPGDTFGGEHSLSFGYRNVPIYPVINGKSVKLAAAARRPPPKRRGCLRSCAHAHRAGGGHHPGGIPRHARDRERPRGLQPHGHPSVVGHPRRTAEPANDKFGVRGPF